MILVVKNYSCPYCIQKSSRRFNMEVHIKRRHHGMGLVPSNPYGAINTNYNLKSNYSPNSVVIDNGVNAWRQTNRYYEENDGLDSVINVLEKQVKIKDLTQRLMSQPSPYYSGPYFQQFYYPNTVDQFTRRSHNFSKLSFRQSSLAIPTGSINISGNAQSKYDEKSSEGGRNIKLNSFQLISLRASICYKCLTIDFIPIYLDQDGTLKEIYNHCCIEDRVMYLERRGNHYRYKLFVVLDRMLPKVLAKVLMYNRSESKNYLCSIKCEGFLSSSSYTDVCNISSLACPIRFFDAFPSENRWLNKIRSSQKREDIIELESKEELLSFLEISRDSTIIILKVKCDSSLPSSSENWDSYFVGLDLSDNNLEKVNKPFIPNFLN